MENAFLAKGVDLPTCSQSLNTSTSENSAENDLDQLMIDLKCKFCESSNYKEKIQILTLKP